MFNCYCVYYLSHTFFFSFHLFQATDAQLSTMVAEQVEQAQAGLKALASSEKNVNQLRQNFVNIERYI